MINDRKGIFAHRSDSNNRILQAFGVRNSFTGRADDLVPESEKIGHGIPSMVLYEEKTLGAVAGQILDHRGK